LLAIILVIVQGVQCLPSNSTATYQGKIFACGFIKQISFVCSS
jgi:hypothetical protein